MTTLLSIHNMIGIISLIGTAIVVFTVVFLMSTSNKEEDKKEATAKIYKLRKKYFWGLIAVLAILLFTSFGFLPYQLSSSDQPSEKVSVLAYQWGWKMSTDTFTEDLSDFKGKSEIDLPINKDIEFIVAAKDVTHGFGIYNSKGTLLTEVQAMPGYENKLHYTFDKKGDYKILCMEYCGLAHAFMIGTIHIK